MAEPRARITIAILGLGGQGGGVLADWIVQLGEANGYATQGTSVPGVAQRTGSTVYYVEWAPREGRDPVMALMPVPGDVDIVIASELMEAGRAILRGFVSARTTLIASTHRVYAISEKSAMGDGRASGERILNAARERAARFIGFDMDAAAAAHGTVISSTLFGALAGSAALPVAREAFEAAIVAGGKGVKASLAGFAAGHDAALSPIADAEPSLQLAPVEPTTATGRQLSARIAAHLPRAAHGFASEAVRRLLDYQDRAYAELYLDRLEAIAARGHDELTREAARHLALWMAYEDTIRVASLKTRATRFDRVRREVIAAPDQIVHVIEYMHPRFDEVCETLPAAIGRRLLASPGWRRRLSPLFAKGRHIRTTGIRAHLMLSALAGMRRFRRSTLKYAEEQARIEGWLAQIASTLDPLVALEIVRCQRLIKGYSDTYARGLASFTAVTGAARALGDQPGAASRIAALRDAALADEAGDALATELSRLAS